MTQSVLESMARAMWAVRLDENHRYGDCRMEPWSDLASARGDYDDVKAEARAALIALRDGVEDAMNDLDNPWAQRSMEYEFNYVLDHVLQEGEKDQIPQGVK